MNLRERTALNQFQRIMPFFAIPGVTLGRERLRKKQFIQRLAAKIRTVIASTSFANPGDDTMSAAKRDVEALLEKLPDECTLEDIQYHLYVLQKIRNGIAAAEEQGVVSQEEAEARLGKWTTP